VPPAPSLALITCDHCPMSKIKVRPMIEAEFDAWQSRAAQEFAAEQVAVGRWEPDGALNRALEFNAELLPLGIHTPRMLFLVGLDATGEVSGWAWVALDHPRGAPKTAFLYDIEIAEPKRGTGLGRALLAAVEESVATTDALALELNVFGRNHPAVALYASSGYAVTTQQMRKELLR
jgi:GNAT superfamily N-acetyltransferase